MTLKEQIRTIRERLNRINDDDKRYTIGNLTIATSYLTDVVERLVSIYEAEHNIKA